VGSGFESLTPHQLKRSIQRSVVDRFADRMPVMRCNRRGTARGPSGHIEQLPSGAWRAKVYGGVDPLVRREIRLPETCKTERAAQIALGKLLEQATVGRRMIKPAPGHLQIRRV
jgi:hypothetical protein